MCYAIPGRIDSLDGRSVMVDYYGEKKKAWNELSHLKVGDYVYAQGGYIIQKVGEEEALAVLSTWKELFFELQDTDLRLSKMKIPEDNGRTSRLLDRIMEMQKFTKEELLYLLKLEKPEEKDLLYKAANFQRQKYLSNSCCVHGIIEFSNVCSRDCFYCGISTHNKGLSRYRMTEQEIIDAAVDACNVYGFKALVLQSGESAYPPEIQADIIRKIKEKVAVLIFISSGEVGVEGLAKLFEAGARGLLMRFETGNPELYKKIRGGLDLSTRLEHLRAAYKMGYLIITGGMIGIPGQTEEDIIDDILLAKSLHSEMYSFGPFIPHPETPFSSNSSPSSELMMKTLAIARLIDPENAKVLVTTGFETLEADALSKGLMAGANSVMLNVTPAQYQDAYDIYPNRAHKKEPIASQIERVLSLLKSIGRAPTDLGVNYTKYLTK